MGKLLLYWFLSTLALGIVTAAVALGDVVLDLIRATGVADLSFSPHTPAIVKAFDFDTNLYWFRLAESYFFIAVPLFIVLTLLPGFFRKSPEPPRIPPPFDPRDAPAAVILTAYNEAPAIGAAVDEFRSVPGVKWVFVIDNNSKDATARIAQEHGAIVVRETHQGYGYTCTRGLREAVAQTSAEVIVLCEGDMTFHGDDMLKLVPYLAEGDMVLGTRTTWDLSRPGAQMDWYISWGNMFLAFLIRLRYWDSLFLGRVRLTDVGCTFRVLRRDATARVVEHLRVGGSNFSSHMILVALEQGLVVLEAPVKFRPRMGSSKLAGSSRWKATSIGLKMFGEILSR